MTKKNTSWVAAKIILKTVGVAIMTLGVLLITSIALVAGEVSEMERMSWI